MPEISEVARIVHFIRKHLVNKTVSKVSAPPDEIVFGKVGTSGAEFEKHMKGKKIVDVGRQGKYFWLIMSSPPHPVLHFGMSGWFKIRSEYTYYYRKKDADEEEEEEEEAEVWPPKYIKFLLTVRGDDGAEEEAAFVDARRLGRVRLVDCDGKDIRKNSPLKENGPDPIIDKALVSVTFLEAVCRRRRVPIKAILLDQAVISGIGNWVADEVLYHAKIHPEQYSNTLSDKQIEQLHESIHYVCGLACELLADSDQYPEDWLFKYRWGKGKAKSDKKLPNGNKIVWLKVGGRTSAVVPAVQKKTGPVAGDLDEEEEEEEEEEGDDPPPQKAKKTNNKKRKVEEDDTEDETAKQPSQKATSRRARISGTKEENVAQENDIDRKSRKRQKNDSSLKPEKHEETDSVPKKSSARVRKIEKVKSVDKETKATTKKDSKGSRANASKPVEDTVNSRDDNRRRSGRLRKQV